MKIQCEVFRDETVLSVAIRSAAAVLLVLAIGGSQLVAQTDTTIASVSTAEDGADLYGFASQFDERLWELGEISVDEFLARYDRPEQFVDALSYDPASEAFIESFQAPAGRERINPFFGPIQRVEGGLELNEDERDVLGKHGFVVSGRHGSHSYTEGYYQVFIRDRPVFISLDSILHAWNQGYRSILEETETYFLAPKIQELIQAMRAQLSAIGDQIHSDLEDSLHDADLYLTIAASLADGETLSTSLGQRDVEVATLMEMISSLELHEFPLFGRTNREIQDFSQFKPRGHYTRTVRLGNYFRSMMWLGRVDLRVAGPPSIASPRELGTALILREALLRSEQLETWTAADRILQTFVGLADSMTVPQLTGLLESSEIAEGETFPSMEELVKLQEKIETSELGVQGITSHGFFATPGGESLKLPRSFTLFGQRFVMDSWALSNLVFDQVYWKGEAVRRRLPSGVDVAFSVFGNTAATSILADRIRNEGGVAFRDGYPIQHHLGALHDVFAQVETENWEDNIYTSWIHTLRQWCQPLDDSIPEVFRTREWAKKTMSAQLASWTHLRHNTVLYAKQSATVPLACSFPHSYLEPNLEAWRTLTAMVRRAATDLAQFAPNVVITDQHVKYLNNFADTCETLTEIVRKQNAREDLTEPEDRFLKDMVEIMVDYVGQRTYSGWYPKLYYVALNRPSPNGPDGNSLDRHPSDLWDPVVTDVHTNFPSPLDGDPGTVLHQAVGNTAMLFVSVACRENRMYAGPVSTYYEFTSGPGNFDRMTDDEWEAMLEEGMQPEEPEWAQKHRFKGKVEIPAYATQSGGAPWDVFPPPGFQRPVFPPEPVFNLPKTIDYRLLDNGRFELKWPNGTTLWRSREVGGARRFVVNPKSTHEGLNTWQGATGSPQFFFWLE